VSWPDLEGSVLFGKKRRDIRNEGAAVGARQVTVTATRREGIGGPG
jgi:hypothetical protein